MSSHVGTVVIGGFSAEKEAIAKYLGAQPTISIADPNLFLEQGKPPCMPILSYPSSLL
jgi:hypothetical protein